jgi:hypothetical protein
MFIDMFIDIAIRHQLSTNIWERGHPACPNASETLTFPVHAQLSQDCYMYDSGAYYSAS